MIRKAAIISIAGPFLTRAEIAILKKKNLGELSSSKEYFIRKSINESYQND